MNARKRWLIVAVALLIPIAAWAQAQGPDGMRRHGRGQGVHGMRHGPGMMARWADLDLTDEQRDKIRDLHEAQARKAVQRRADIQLARLDLHRLMREERPNSASVSMAIGRIARLHEEGMKARFETHMQARALLTPEQRKQLMDRLPGTRHEPGDFEL
jgi:Spy/CpxP family protein refolding chaperone